MLDFKTLRVKSYPSVPLSQVSKLPKEPGIYYAVSGWDIHYIGLSKNLYRRWNATGEQTHHKRAILVRYGGVKLHYRVLPAHEIEYVEALEIDRFRPHLNIVRPIAANHLNWRIRFSSAWFFLAIVLLGFVGLAIVDRVETQKPPTHNKLRNTLTIP